MYKPPQKIERQESEKFLEKKTLEVSYQSQSLKLVQVEAKVNGLVEAKGTHASIMQALQMELEKAHI